MKQISVTLIMISVLCAAIALLLNGCRDNYPTQVSYETNALILGSWKWVSSDGGMFGYPDVIGYTEKISFKPYNVFERYQNDTLVESSHYSIEVVNLTTFIHYANPYIFTQVAQLRSIDTLTLEDCGADGNTDIFCRVR